MPDPTLKARLMSTWRAMRDEAARIAAMKEPPEHPEDYCNRCGQRNVPWSGPSEIWNEVCRGGGIDIGIICPACFTELAAEKGYRVFWTPSVDAKKDQGSNG